jgi:adenylylsulfate reductase subunit B
MSIAIDKAKCKGCKKCTAVCPGSLIKCDKDGKAYIKYPKDCWGCASCVKECQFHAISFYLGADIGGMGSQMTVRSEGDYLNWDIEKTDGTIETITINKKDSNKY